MDTFLEVLFLFLVARYLGKWYVNGVHNLGATIIKHCQPWLVRILSFRLWTTEWDRSREVNKIGLQAEDKLNKRWR